MNLWKGLKGKVKFNEPLSKHTTFRIGGCPAVFIEPFDTEEIKQVLSISKKHKLKVLCIGSGSNILACDKQINAAVIHLCAPSFKKLAANGRYVEAGCGTHLAELIKFSLNKGLSGVEFLTGIPGTVGGALVMNAGGWGKKIGDLVAQITVMDYNGKIKAIKNKDAKFKYRSSGLGKYIVLSARLKLFPEDKKYIKQQLNEYIAYRKNTQDLMFPSAGCVFKNPGKESAGRLIDLCGLKGRRIGGAIVSLMHANFILNRKDASAKDVLKLKDIITKAVKAKFGIKLEPEIKIWQ